MRKKNARRQFTRKHSLSLREEIVALLERSNVYLQPERRVAVATAVEVANRDLRKTRGGDPNARIFSALRAVSSHVSLAAKNKITTAALSNSDLLPIGHPMSTKPHAMTASALRRERARWVAADELIDDSVRSLVATAHAAEPGSIERRHAFLRISALGPGLVPITAAVDLNTETTRASEFVAGFGVGGNSAAARSARAKLQRRDRRGRFAFMGGGFSFNLRGLDGMFKKLSGRVVGASGDDLVEIEVKGHASVPDGIYALPASKGDSSKAILPEDALKDLPIVDAMVSKRRAIDQSSLRRLDAPTGWTRQTSAVRFQGRPIGGPEIFTSDDGYFVKKDGDTFTLHRANLADNTIGDEVARGTSWADMQKGALEDQDDYAKLIASEDAKELIKAADEASKRLPERLERWEDRKAVLDMPRGWRLLDYPEYGRGFIYGTNDYEAEIDRSLNKLVIKRRSTSDAPYANIVAELDATSWQDVDWDEVSKVIDADKAFVKKFKSDEEAGLPLDIDPVASIGAQIDYAIRKKRNVRFNYGGKTREVTPVERWRNPKTGKTNLKAREADGTEKNFSFDKIESPPPPAPEIRDDKKKKYDKLVNDPKNWEQRPAGYGGGRMEWVYVGPDLEGMLPPSSPPASALRGISPEIDAALDRDRARREGRDTTLEDLRSVLEKELKPQLPKNNPSPSKEDAKFYNADGSLNELGKRQNEIRDDKKKKYDKLVNDPKNWEWRGGEIGGDDPGRLVYVGPRLPDGAAPPSRPSSDIDKVKREEHREMLKSIRDFPRRRTTPPVSSTFFEDELDRPLPTKKATIEELIERGKKISENMPLPLNESTIDRVSPGRVTPEEREKYYTDGRLNGLGRAENDRRSKENAKLLGEPEPAELSSSDSVDDNAAKAREAIDQKSKLRFEYNGKPREVVPSHIYTNPKTGTTNIVGKDADGVEKTFILEKIGQPPAPEAESVPVATEAAKEAVDASTAGRRIVDVSSSTAVERMEYNPETRELFVQFKTKDGKWGGAYRYDDVSPEFVDRLAGAESVGKMIPELKKSHSVSKLDEFPEQPKPPTEGKPSLVRIDDGDVRDRSAVVKEAIANGDVILFKYHGKDRLFRPERVYTNPRNGNVNVEGFSITDDENRTFTLGEMSAPDPQDVDSREDLVPTGKTEEKTAARVPTPEETAEIQRQQQINKTFRNLMATDPEFKKFFEENGGGDKSAADHLREYSDSKAGEGLVSPDQAQKYAEVFDGGFGQVLADDPLGESSEYDGKWASETEDVLRSGDLDALTVADLEGLRQIYEKRVSDYEAADPTLRDEIFNNAEDRAAAEELAAAIDAEHGRVAAAIYDSVVEDISSRPSAFDNETDADELIQKAIDDAQSSGDIASGADAFDDVYDKINKIREGAPPSGPGDDGRSGLGFDEAENVVDTLYREDLISREMRDELVARLSGTIEDEGRQVGWRDLGDYFNEMYQEEAWGRESASKALDRAYELIEGGPGGPAAGRTEALITPEQAETFSRVFDDGLSQVLAEDPFKAGNFTYDNEWADRVNEALKTGDLEELSVADLYGLRMIYDQRLFDYSNADESMRDEMFDTEADKAALDEIDDVLKKEHKRVAESIYQDLVEEVSSRSSAFDSDVDIDDLFGERMDEALDRGEIAPSVESIDSVDREIYEIMGLEGRRFLEGAIEKKQREFVSPAEAFDVLDGGLGEARDTLAEIPDVDLDNLDDDDSDTIEKANDLLDSARRALDFVDPVGSETNDIHFDEALADLGEAAELLSESSNGDMQNAGLRLKEALREYLDLPQIDFSGSREERKKKAEAPADSDLRDYAQDVVDMISDYPDQDPSEVADEMIANISREEELTPEQTDRLRELVTDLMDGGPAEPPTGESPTGGPTTDDLFVDEDYLKFDGEYRGEDAVIEYSGPEQDEDRNVKVTVSTPREELLVSYTSDEFDSPTEFAQWINDNLGRSAYDRLVKTDEPLRPPVSTSGPAGPGGPAGPAGPGGPRFYGASFAQRALYNGREVDLEYDNSDDDEGVYRINVKDAEDDELIEQLSSEDYDSLREFADAIKETFGQEVYDSIVTDEGGPAGPGGPRPPYVPPANSFGEWEDTGDFVSVLRTEAGDYSVGPPSEGKYTVTRGRGTDPDTGGYLREEEIPQKFDSLEEVSRWVEQDASKEIDDMLTDEALEKPSAGGMPQALVDEFDDRFETPDGAYKPNIFELYVARGGGEDASFDYTDDPTALAQKFTAQELSRALMRAVLPSAGEDATGVGDLDFGDGDEGVPAEALYEALEIQGEVNPEFVLANIYDSALDPDREMTNVERYNIRQSDEDILGDDTALVPKAVPISDEEARQLNKRVSSPENASNILRTMDSFDETSPKLQSLADRIANFDEFGLYDEGNLSRLLDEYMPLAFSDDEEDTMVFSALWGMLMSIDGGASLASESGGETKEFRPTVFAAISRAFPDEDPQERYDELVDVFGGFNEFVQGKLAVAEGREALDSGSVGASFLRLMKASMAPSKETLYRSFGVAPSNAELLERYTTPGSKFSLDPRPFSSIDFTQDPLSWRPTDRSHHRVIFVAPPGDLNSVSATPISWFESENEHLGSGDFEVESVRRVKSIFPRAADEFVVTLKRAEGTPEGAETSEAPAAPELETFDTSSWRKTGGQAGSNPGGFYEDEDGNGYYVKLPKSRSHLDNETLASVFYEELGVPAAKVRPGEADGDDRIVSVLIPGAVADLRDHLDDEEYLDKLRDGFAVDAWLSNYDVTGTGWDNVVTDENGNPVRVDPGGALMWRARGLPKEGMFGDEVAEIDGLRDPDRNSYAAAVFGAMTDDDVRESAKKLIPMTPERIGEIVDRVVSDPEDAAYLKMRLENRRRNILDRFGLKGDEEEDGGLFGKPIPLNESMGYPAADLQPGDVTTGDSFVIERVFKDDDTPAGKVSIQGYFPGHESQRKEWNEGTVIDVSRGNETIPPKGDLPALHKPKKPGYAPTPPAFSGESLQDLLSGATSWDDVRERLRGRTLVFFDYETTGIPKPSEGDFSTNQPVQLGAVKVVDGVVVDRINLFMDPGEPLGAWARDNLKDADGNPLTDEMLQSQIGKAEAHAQFADWAGPDVILVAHNTPFDREVLERTNREGNVEFTPAGYIDTLRLSRDMLPKRSSKNPDAPEGHRLPQLMDHYGLEFEGWHTADADSMATYGLFNALLDDGSQNRPESFDKSVGDIDAANREYEEKAAAHAEAVRQHEQELADYNAKKAVAAAWNCASGITAAGKDSCSNVPSLDELIEMSKVQPGELSDPEAVNTGNPEGDPVAENVLDVPEADGVDARYSIEGNVPDEAQQQTDLDSAFNGAFEIGEEVTDPESGILKTSDRKKVSDVLDELQTVRDGLADGSISREEALERLNDLIDRVPEGKGDASDYLLTLSDYIGDVRRVLDLTMYQRPTGPDLPPIDSPRGYSKDGIFVLPGMRVRDKWGYVGTVLRYNKQGWFNVFFKRDVDDGTPKYLSKGTRTLTVLGPDDDQRPWIYSPSVPEGKRPDGWEDLVSPEEREAADKAYAAKLKAEKDAKKAAAKSAKSKETGGEPAAGTTEAIRENIEEKAEENFPKAEAPEGAPEAPEETPKAPAAEETVADIRENLRGNREAALQRVQDLLRILQEDNIALPTSLIELQLTATIESLDDETLENLGAIAEIFAAVYPELSQVFDSTDDQGSDYTATLKNEVANFFKIYVSGDFERKKFFERHNSKSREQIEQTTLDAIVHETASRYVGTSKLLPFSEKYAERYNPKPLSYTRYRATVVKQIVTKAGVRLLSDDAAKEVVEYFNLEEFQEAYGLQGVTIFPVQSGYQPIIDFKIALPAGSNADQATVDRALKEAISQVLYIEEAKNNPDWWPETFTTVEQRLDSPSNKSTSLPGVTYQFDSASLGESPIEIAVSLFKMTQIVGPHHVLVGARRDPEHKLPDGTAVEGVLISVNVDRNKLRQFQDLINDEPRLSTAQERPIQESFSGSYTDLTTAGPSLPGISGVIQRATDKLRNKTAEVYRDGTLVGGTGVEPVTVLAEESRSLSKSNFDGVQSLMGAVSAVVDKQSPDPSLSPVETALVDGGDVEDMTVRAYTVRTKEGRKLRLRLKLTAWAARRKMMEIESADGQGGWTKTDGVYLHSTGTRADGDIATKSIESIARSAEAGRVERYLDYASDEVTSGAQPTAGYEGTGFTYTTDLGDGTAIRLFTSYIEPGALEVNSNRDDSSFALHGEVTIDLPIDATEEDISKALAAAGVSDVRTATQDDLDILIENKLMSVYGTRQGYGKAELNEGDEDRRQTALDEIKNMYGISPEDVKVTTDRNGNVSFVIPKKLAKKIALDRDVTYYKHGGMIDPHSISILRELHPQQDGESSYNYRARLMAIAYARLIATGLSPTRFRLQEGVNTHGMSSLTDIRTGGADYVFFYPHTGTASFKKYPGSADFSVVFDAAEALRQVDFATNVYDDFGRRVLERSMIEILKPGNQEAMLKGVVPLDGMAAFVTDPELVPLIISELWRQGITELGGRPIEQVIVSQYTISSEQLTQAVSKKLDDAIDELAVYYHPPSYSDGALAAAEASTGVAFLIDTLNNILIGTPEWDSAADTYELYGSELRSLIDTDTSQLSGEPGSPAFIGTSTIGKSAVAKYIYRGEDGKYYWRTAKDTTLHPVSDEDVEALIDVLELGDGDFALGGAETNKEEWLGVLELEASTIEQAVVNAQVLREKDKEKGEVTPQSDDFARATVQTGLLNALEIYTRLTTGKISDMKHYNASKLAASRLLDVLNLPYFIREGVISISDIEAFVKKFYGGDASWAWKI